MSIREDETTEFWRSFSHEDLAIRTAALHAQRRELSDRLIPEFVAGARYAIANQFTTGSGIEVGAGPRPFPLPPNVTCLRGDILEEIQLKKYFNVDADLPSDLMVDAQTFRGLPDSSFDFVISAHVIEHLLNPIGSIESGMRIIKPRGHYILAVPDMRYTFDVHRPITPLDHLLADWKDGGYETQVEAYPESIKYVGAGYFGHPELPDADLMREAHAAADARLDVHFHTWTFDSFIEMLDAIKEKIGFEIAVSVGNIVNENIFVLRKRF